MCENTVCKIPDLPDFNVLANIFQAFEKVAKFLTMVADKFGEAVAVAFDTAQQAFCCTTAPYIQTGFNAAIATLDLATCWADPLLEAAANEIAKAFEVKLWDPIKISLGFDYPGLVFEGVTYDEKTCSMDGFKIDIIWHEMELTIPGLTLIIRGRPQR